MKYIVTISDTVYEVEVEEGQARLLSATQAIKQPTPEAVVRTPDVLNTAGSPLANAPNQLAAGEVISAPMPGVVVKIEKNVGDTVKRGETLVLLEAMKMENEIAAIKDGVVAQILTTKGASVTTGAPLVVIQ